MILKNVTRKQIIEYINGLESQLYNVTITPIESQSIESTPIKSQSIESTPIESQSIESTPIKSQSIESQSIESTPIESQSIESQSIKSQSIESTPIKSQSIESTPIKSQSIESTTGEIPDFTHKSTLRGVFDTTKKILEKVTHVNYIHNHVRCELVDLSEKYNKLASISRSDNLYKTVLINTGTYKFKSIKHDRLLLSLHYAECIFREVLYDTYGKVDIDILDNCVDEYYTACFANLKSKYTNNG